MIGEQQWFSAADLAGLPGMPGSTRGVNKAAAREGWSSRKRRKGKGYEYAFDDLPAETQAAILKHSCAASPQGAALPADTAHDAPAAAAFTYDRDELWAQYERKAKGPKGKAQQRLALLDQVMRLVDAGQPIKDAFRNVGQANGTSWRTISGWYYGTNGKPGARDFERADWLAALVPGYVGRTVTAECSPGAWEYFKADYLRLAQPAATACYERLQRIAPQKGWTVPSLKTLERRIEREIAPGALILARQGREALAQSYPAQQRDRSVFHALEAVNADGHKFDVFVRWPDGDVTRPMMVAWQCLYSGKLLGWRIDRSENADSYRLSFGDVVERYGIPEHAYLDNGRGIASKMLTGGAPTRYRFKIKDEDPVGILPQMGTTPHWTTPYHGQAKPIERAFRDLCEYVAKHPALEGAYTGNSPMAKPENYGSRAVDLADFLAVLDTEIKAHNAREGRRSTVCAGRSFDETFAESYARSEIRRATAGQRRLWLLAAEGVRASRQTGAITLMDNTYWSDCLARHKGDKLIVRFDPDHLHEAVYAYTLDGRFIGAIECAQAAGFNDTRAAREHARLRKQFVNANRTALEREKQLSAADAARQLPTETDDADPPERRVVRGTFKQTRQVVNGAPLTEPSDETEESQAETRFGWHDVMDRGLDHLRSTHLGGPTHDDTET
ncbi:transposase domain-containing protein [Salinisphaera orenii]|uniref:DNA-binding protein n=1 Tax=Salinisphaera orenii YIM 95161 TaxID=1051139 RepID=A0A423PRI1_9GAMM|nr:transposase domain-containing protein [Salinisphaera halophila]ROO28226.1 DNA-binding protein [Salinisphaera halophila YIM 95161]